MYDALEDFSMGRTLTTAPNSAECTVPDTSRYRLPPWIIVAGATGLGVALRLALTYAHPGNYDQRSYEIVAGIMRRGGNVYQETHRYNYSPFWAYCLLLFSLLGDAVSLPLHIIVRTCLTGVDVLVAACIALISGAVPLMRRSHAYALYMLNPVPILIVGYHGQFENLAMLPLLVAVYLLVSRRTPSPLLIVGLLAMAVIIKHNVVFPVWLILWYIAPSPRRAALWMVLVVTAFSASFLPFLQQGWPGIVANVFGYSSGARRYGLDLFLPVPLSRGIFFLALIAHPFIARTHMRLPLAQGVQFSIVIFLSCIYGFSDQYFILPVMLGAICCLRWHNLYTVATTIMLASSTNNIQIIDIPRLTAINMVWFVLVAWLARYFVTGQSILFSPPQPRKQ